MKKIILPLLAVAGIFTSCDMDLLPNGYRLDEVAITTPSDAEMFRNGFYNSLRIIGSGYIQKPEIQADMFIGTIINGNRLGDVNNGTFNSSSGEVTGGFGAMYGQVGSINYFLPRAQALIDEGMVEEKEDEVLKYIGEALFTRAYCYYWLTDHYCQAYTTDNGDEPALGMPIQAVYDPSPVISTYPGRSTLNETYKFIEEDLDSCFKIFTYIEEKYGNAKVGEGMNVQNASVLGSNVVLALQARLALLKQDWQKAYDYSDEIIKTNKYRLCTLLTFPNMWKTDKGTEVIFLPYCDKSELGGLSSTGGTWLSSYEDKTDYIPTGGALKMYEKWDIRPASYFGTREINVFGMMYNVPIFNKFPGNSEFNVTSSNALLNRPKMFRLAEQILIKAEAAYHLGKYDEANTLINQLRSARSVSGADKYVAQTYTADELLDQVKIERTRELIGEGFRISDLRRWGDGFIRVIAYDDEEYMNAPIITVVAGRGLEYDPGDYRYVWPLPVAELQTNPQIADQQNPGY